jgi:hypothetical protein
LGMHIMRRWMSILIDYDRPRFVMVDVFAWS